MNRQLIEIASWRIACEVHRKYPDRIRIIETHPCSGQYDCLAILDTARRGVTAELNRGGSLHVFNNHDHQILSDIWREMSQDSNTKSIVDKICRMLDLPQIDKVPFSTPSTLVYRYIATFLTHAAFGIHSWECRSGMCDSSGYSGGVVKDFERFPLAQERLRVKLEDDLPGDPSYRFWFLQKENTPFICLETTGFLWMRGNDKTNDLMDIYNNNDRKIWPTIVSLAGPLMS